MIFPRSRLSFRQRHRENLEARDIEREISVFAGDPADGTGPIQALYRYCLNILIVAKYVNYEICFIGFQFSLCYRHSFLVVQPPNHTVAVTILITKHTQNKKNTRRLLPDPKRRGPHNRRPNHRRGTSPQIAALYTCAGSGTDGEGYRDRQFAEEGKGRAYSRRKGSSR